MRLPRLLLALTILALAGGNIAATLSRSLIPYALDGDVEEIELRFEKRRGIDDVYLVTVDERQLHVDPAVGRRIDEGDYIRKDAWTTALGTSVGEIPLRPSPDFWRMLLVMPVVAISALVLFRPPRPLRPRPAPRVDARARPRR